MRFKSYQAHQVGRVVNKKLEELVLNFSKKVNLKVQKELNEFPGELINSY